EREDGRTSDRHREPVERLRLSPAEQQTLRDIGRFRAIHTGDLQRYGYGNKAGAMKSDLRHLREEGLVKQHTILHRGQRASRPKPGMTGSAWARRGSTRAPCTRSYASAFTAAISIGMALRIVEPTNLWSRRTYGIVFSSFWTAASTLGAPNTLSRTRGW
ncbi:MAG: hypothetical protein ABSG25_04305, partial [Bryobacteraceae bacterium]